MLTMQGREEEFLEAIRKNDQPTINRLLQEHPSIANTRTKNGVSAIFLALYRGNSSLATKIASMKQLDVFEAASIGDLAQLKTLIAHDPSLAKTYSPDGFTALALASYLGQKGSVEYLTENGADVNAIAKDGSRFTPLTGAASQNHNEIAKILVKKGAVVDHQYEGGFTPLMHACAAGNIELVTLLLENGANPNAKNSEGKTPLSFALEKSNNDLADYLRKHGAN
ncbi:MAG TPA: ankyrin repeat domain-containing protein [Candidatus Bathyarchaeia archaeon]|nr:ankyrin repeat domain-containing protein [Candidatus Bathyarchaeia archaeon]